MKPWNSFTDGDLYMNLGNEIPAVIRASGNNILVATLGAVQALQALSGILRICDLTNLSCLDTFLASM